jgi:hypothetical protein
VNADKSEVVVATGDPFRYVVYPATPTLSVDASHASVSDVWVTLVIRGLPGVDGGAVSVGVGQAAVVAVRLLLLGETFPAASLASTAKL